MKTSNWIQKYFTDSSSNTQMLAESSELQGLVQKAIEMISESYQQGGRLFIAGNGGSAADAQHISAEMVGKLDKDRTPLAAFALHADTSLMTAVGNDYGYDFIFSRQVEGLMTEKDIFWGITTSGNSKNIIKALEVAQRKKVKSILLTGKEGGEARKRNLADLCLIAPGAHTALIQQNHIVMYHAICFGIENTLIEKGFIKYF